MINKKLDPKKLPNKIVSGDMDTTPLKTKISMSEKVEGRENDYKHKGYKKKKLGKTVVFFVSGPLISLKSLISGALSGNYAETIRGSIEGAALLIEGVGFGGFVKSIRDSKFFQTLSNGIEYFFPKPIRTLVAIGCSIAAIVTSGGWISIAGLVTTLLLKAYSIYSDIKTHKKTESKIEELSLAKKNLISIAAKNQSIELLKRQNPSIKINDLVKDFEKSISSSPTLGKPEEDIKSTSFLLSIGENAGVFSTSIAAGLAMSAIRSVGATAYTEMKLSKLYGGLKTQLTEIKEKIPTYRDKTDLINQLNNQVCLVQALSELGTEQKFLQTTDQKEAMKMLKEKFNKQQSAQRNLIKLKEPHSNWKAFLDTENRKSNYGNITHDDSIESEDKAVLAFENNMKARIRKTEGDFLKKQAMEKNIESISTGLQNFTFSVEAGDNKKHSHNIPDRRKTFPPSQSNKQ
jgi:hypothetical protein